MIKEVNLNNSKFLKSFQIDEWEIETEDGFKPISHIHKTIKYQKYVLKTKSHTLICADNHLIICINNNILIPKYAKDLIVNKDLIITDSRIRISIIYR